MKYLTKRAPAAALLLSLALILSACGKQAAPDAEDSVISSAVTDAQDPRSDAASSTASAAETGPAAESGSSESEAESSPSSGSTSMQEIPVIPAESTVSEPEETGNGYTIVIDAGHQARQNKEQEPIGPGSSETKKKVSSGTAGKVSGLDEYELNLILALKLQDILEERGYEVIQVRTTHDVDIPNSERAAIANEAEADAFIRIHANGSSDSSVKGAETICQKPDNPWNGDIYEECRALSDAVIDALAEETGCENDGVWETNSMSGINWCAVPVTIVEVGYMSNPEEDELLGQEDYQNKIALGIANGIDDFIGISR